MLRENRGKDQISISPHETPSTPWVPDAALIGGMPERKVGIVSMDGGLGRG